MPNRKDKTKICTKCDGNGRIQIGGPGQRKCPSCKGTGRIDVNKDDPKPEAKLTD